MERNLREQKKDIALGILEYGKGSPRSVLLGAFVVGELQRGGLKNIS
jgi:hypothetical protein